jgi:hypothetical protein
MNFLDAFQKPGRWLKVALHAHTTETDGLLSPADAVSFYKGLGYDAMAITDHGKATPVTTLNDPTFAVIPGIELDGANKATGELHHIIALGVTEPPGENTDLNDPQAIIDWVNAQGGLASFAHPHWSGNRAGTVASLKGLWGLEVWNSVCESERFAGRAMTYWDEVLRRSERVWGVAVDDAHYYDPALDAGNGWVMVKAEANTAENILAALREGHFYASSGPVFSDVRIVGDELIVTCGDVSAIVVIDLSAQPYYPAMIERAGTPGGPRDTLKGAHFTIKSENAAYWRYFRVSCHDSRGLAAWGQPIRLQG